MDQRNFQTRLIPQSALRRLYELLGEFPSTEFHLAFLKECTRAPARIKSLDSMIGRSADHVKEYQNHLEPFHCRNLSGGLTDKRWKSSRKSDRLVRMAFANSVKTEDPSLAFDYVDYEISPLRTIHDVRQEDGSPSPGGGIDLLLSNQFDKVPIIGEIKAEKDKNLFYALIQALTYASELATLNQQSRLNKTYPNRFAMPPATPIVDIYLIQVEPPQNKWTDQFLKGVRTLAEKLLDERSTSQLIRKIACLQSKDSSNNGIILETTFLYSSKLSALSSST